jgi:hypothetical protein
MQTSRGVEVILETLNLAQKLPAADLACWTADIGPLAIECRSTDPATSSHMAGRMVNLNSRRTQSDFTFDLLETSSLGWPYPSDWVGSSLDRARLNQALADQGIGSFIPPDEVADRYFPWMIFDPQAKHGVVLLRTIADLPPWLASAPFAQLVHFALATRGARLVHAGTLGTEHGGVLIVGVGGSGKSATTLSGISQGLSTVGDDLVAVDAETEPTAWPVYRRFKQLPSGLARFPDLARGTASSQLNWNGKVDFDPDLARPGSFMPSMKLRGIFVASISGQDQTRIEPARSSDVFSVMARDMFALMPGARAVGFSFLTRLTRQLPTFWLRLSNDPKDVGRRIKAHLCELAS